MQNICTQTMRERTIEYKKTKSKVPDISDKPIKGLQDIYHLEKGGEKTAREPKRAPNCNTERIAQSEFAYGTILTSIG